MTEWGAFAPIESVIAEAERRAVIEWEREHEPCPHPVLDLRMCDVHPRCAYCGVEVVE